MNLMNTENNTDIKSIRSRPFLNYILLKYKTTL